MNDLTQVLLQVIQWFGTITNNIFNWLNEFQIEIGQATFSILDLMLTFIIIGIAMSILITLPNKQDRVKVERKNSK